MKKILLITMVTSLFLVSCSNSNKIISNDYDGVESGTDLSYTDETLTFTKDPFVIGGMISINSSKIESSTSNVEKEFLVDNYVIIYNNVYNDGKNNFVIKPGGYIKTKQKIYNLLKFDFSYGIKVLYCDSNANLIEPEVEVEDYGLTDGKKTFIISSYVNVEILNESDNEINIGYLTFWD